MLASSVLGITRNKAALKRSHALLVEATASPSAVCSKTKSKGEKTFARCYDDGQRGENV